MNDPFEPPITDRALPEVVREMRSEAAKMRREAERSLRPLVERRCRRYLKMIDGFAEVLLVPLETSDLDLAARTRWTVLWSLSARTLSLARALVTLVQAGYCGEAFPTARAVFEINRMLLVFREQEGTDLARQWLDGKTPKPSTIAKAMRRIEVATNAQRVAVGQPPVPSARAAQEKLYGALSESGHGSRASMDQSISHSTRQVVVGPNPDWGMRAYYVSWAGDVVWEACHVVGLVQAPFLGRRLYEEHIVPSLNELADIDASHPLPREHVRNVPLEFEVED